jgi:hypothetical protein
MPKSGRGVFLDRWELDTLRLGWAATSLFGIVPQHRGRFFTGQV